MSRLLRYLPSLTALLAIACQAPRIAVAAPARAAETTPIHWAYAPYFGTGRYHAQGSEEILALSVKPGWQWRESALSDDGKRTLGLRVRVPVSVAVHDFNTDDVLGSVDLDNVNTLSAVPGVEIDIRMSDRWRLKPLLYAGWGGQLHGDDAAWIYWAGLMSELAFKHGKIEWSLVNGLTWLGFSPRDAASQQVFPLTTGFEFRRPLERRRLGGDTVYLDWHIAYTHYFEDLDFATPLDRAGRTVSISEDIEIGLAFSKGNRELSFWRLSFDRIGLAYRFDADGDFSGISLVTKSLFDR
jgi:hypothetical protein